MKIIEIVGGRPQFIKLAVVSHAFQKIAGDIEQVILHTGQHYDYNMSEEFFEELDIPCPKYNLGISGGTHGDMTGRMLIGIEDVLIKESPDWVLVFGDMNSTLAGALAAVKLHIPIGHVEAGGRSHTLTSPEEVNRICTDHVSTLLFAATEGDVKLLQGEGIGDRAVFVGNTMYDAFLQYSVKLKPEDITLELLSGGTAQVPDDYYYMSCHREENTHDDETLMEILKAMESLDAPTIFPVHPRNKERALRLKESLGYKNVIMTEPVGYLESTCLTKNSIKVVTDSGGLRTEAFFAGKKVVIIDPAPAWPEIFVGGRAEVSEPKAEYIIEKLSHPQQIEPSYQPFGDGHASDKIVNAIVSYGKDR